jgi:hypothetical protein
MEVMSSIDAMWKKRLENLSEVERDLIKGISSAQEKIKIPSMVSTEYISLLHHHEVGKLLSH